MSNIDINFTFKSIKNTYYKVLQKIGSGGNSDVYLVFAESGVYSGILFALKVFKKIHAADRLERFEREYDFLREFKHPAIMSVYDNGRTSITIEKNDVTVPFIVAEYLPITLAKQIHTNIPFIEKVSYSYQLISAINYLHNHNPPVIHRDIKPRNIFIKGKSCVIGDFGLMKFLAPGVNFDGNAYLDTVDPAMPANYRTPDLVDYANGIGELTVQTDIFQLGLVLAEIFTRYNPCEKPKLNKLTDPVRLNKIRQIQGDTGSQIQNIISQMLNITRNDRPNSGKLLEDWKAIFLRVADQYQRIDGKAII